MSVATGAVGIAARACEATGGDGLGDQYLNPLPPPGTGEVACEVSAFHVQLALAGGITDPFHLIFKVLMTITWAIYQFQVIALAWVTDFVLGMTWLDWFTDIAGDFQDSIAGILKEVNAYEAMLAVTALVCVIWMARGLWAKGFLQLLLSLIIVNYAVAAVSYNGHQEGNNSLAPINPISWLIGDNDSQEGLLYDARDTAHEFVGRIAPQDEAQTPGESILQTFLYHPAMLVNFGFILDGDCERAYVIALSHAGNSTSKDDLVSALGGLRGEGSAADGVDTGSELTDPGTWWGGTGDEPVDYDPEVWKVVGSCTTDNVDAFAKMARPDSWMAQFAIQPAVTILAVLILIMAGVAFIAGLSALIQCIKLLVTLLLAVLPGGARSVLWRNIGQLFAAVLMMIFCIVFLGVFLQVVTDIMASDSTPTGDPDARSVRWAEIGKFILVDLLLVAGIVLFWRGRGAVNETKDRVAAAMSSKFGGGGGGGGFGGSSLVPAGGGGARGAIQRMAGNFNSMNDAARNMGGQSAQGRFQGIIRRTSGIAGTVGLAMATGGGSVAVKGGAAVARSYPTQHLKDKLSLSAGGRVEQARRKRMDTHFARGEHAAVNRIGTSVRRAEALRAVRSDKAKLRSHDWDTRRASLIVRATGGRRGAERVNTASERKKQMLEDFEKQRQVMERRHTAERAREMSRLTPDERRIAEDRERRLAQRDLWREARRAAREGRRGGSGGTSRSEEGR